VKMRHIRDDSDKLQAEWEMMRAFRI